MLGAGSLVNILRQARLGSAALPLSLTADGNEKSTASQCALHETREAWMKTLSQVCFAAKSLSRFMFHTSISPSEVTGILQKVTRSPL